MEKQYLKRLARLGILPETAGIDNILDLTVKDLMERRLQTIVQRQGLARTIHQARQFVSHGHISVSGQIVSVPGYIVQRDEESKIVFHQRSPLNNPQHPVRAAVGAKRPTTPRIIEEPTAPTAPALPEVPAEIKEIAQTEQPIEISEPEEELTPATEEAPPDKQP